MISEFICPPVPHVEYKNLDRKDSVQKFPVFIEFHDFQIAEYLRQVADESVPIWKLVKRGHMVDQPKTRRQRRNIVLLILQRIRVLLEKRFLVRFDRKHIALAGLPIVRPLHERRLKAPVRTIQLSVNRVTRTPTVHDSS